eukprot:SAG22_NODE_2495_length_2512_cov_1.362619_2_plen_270_part_00
MHAFEPHSSAIDWCEDNYAVTPHIAEFWNCLTALLFAFPVAPLAVYLFRRYARGVTPHTYVLWVLMVAAGLGSGWFHAALSHAGQLVDELAVLWLIFYASMFTRGPGGSGGCGRVAYELAFHPGVVCGYTLTTLTACYAAPFWGHLFCIAHCPLLVVVFAVEYQKHKDALSPEMKRVFFTSNCLIAAGVLCWLLDKFCCSKIKAALGFYPQLHALWHVFGYAASWGALVAGTFCRARNDVIGSRVALRYTGGVRWCIPPGLPYTECLDV